jgi:divalent metal cation (Fe/Co/Zn/Cd) transporter
VLAALIVFLAGVALGTRFTVFALIPFGVLIALFCIALGYVWSDPATALFAWFGLVVAINVGFLVGRVCRSFIRGHMLG